MYLYFILFMLFFKVLGVGGLLRAETVIKPSRDAGSSDGSLFTCKPCCCAQPRAQQLPFFWDHQPYSWAYNSQAWSLPPTAALHTDTLSLHSLLCSMPHWSLRFSSEARCDSSCQISQVCLREATGKPALPFLKELQKDHYWGVIKSPCAGRSFIIKDFKYNTISVIPPHTHTHHYPRHWGSCKNRPSREKCSFVLSDRHLDLAHHLLPFRFRSGWKHWPGGQQPSRGNQAHSREAHPR